MVQNLDKSRDLTLFLKSETFEAFTIGSSVLGTNLGSEFQILAVRIEKKFALILHFGTDVWSFR